MKNAFLILSLMIGFIASGYSQCSINPFIETNYDIDAKILALREILSDPADPDYDNPFIPQARVIPYLEKLSAIYENPNNEPIIDSLFNEFQMHANHTYNVGTEYQGLIFSVDTNVSWVQTLKDTGTSGYAPLDDFFSTYQLSVTEYIDLMGMGVTHFTMHTSFDFLNVFAILNDLEAIQDINSADITIAAHDLNYSGIPYLVNGEWVEVCDIIEEGNVYTFCLYSGDCLASCLYSRCWSVEVSPDCNTVTLGVSNMSYEKIAVFPNPVKDKLRIQGVTSEIHSTLIYSVSGNLIQRMDGRLNTLDVSKLSGGIYFLQIITTDGKKQIQKFIKK